MKTCLYCDKKTTDEENDRKCTDHFHPYIDDYEAMRRVYFDWADHWEDEIIERGKNFQWSVDDVLDLIAEEMEPYWDYYIKQVDDGVFAQEIYKYYLNYSSLK